MTIQNKTARALMYSWHGGMSSPLYAAASSGLAESFAALAVECDQIGDAADRSKLLCWIQKKQAQAKTKIVVTGRSYFVLPWVSKSYFGDTKGRAK